jgi:hypothetical protein
MQFKQLIYRRAVLIGEGFTTDPELDYMWAQDQDMAWAWLDNLWQTRNLKLNKEATEIAKANQLELQTLRPLIIAQLAPSGGWKARPNAYNADADAEADKYRIKTTREIRDWWERRRANVKV